MGSGGKEHFGGVHVVSNMLYNLEYLCQLWYISVFCKGTAVYTFETRYGVYIWWVVQ